MLFVLTAIDNKKTGLSLRAENRPKHLEFLEGLGDKLFLAGPFMESDTPIGSLVIIEADDMTDAEEIFAKDPYALAGVFEKIDIKEWKLIYGNDR